MTCLDMELGRPAAEVCIPSLLFFVLVMGAFNIPERIKLPRHSTGAIKARKYQLRLISRL